ncbi:restriction endonuclease [Pseudomonas xanthosomatis]|uniref:restriction endonuclease n=1 Tax=Pseudomonas xanthosomatis TaxID=2842356 RepID=UPI001C3CFAF4|nr:restriction endonuclease [Pseudomonas xanthosomatis]QXH45239.1 restriction endonuclease [Pseudomonas xanthosomatis]
MERISLHQIPPPTDWQDFERLCKDLWSKLLGDLNTQRNGRSGQPQHGVDVYGVDPSNMRWGVQCKGKDNYTAAQSIVTTDELDNEILKAENFTPPIHHFVLATTAPKDSKIESHARKISARHAESGKFSVTVMGWSDIVEHIEKHPEILKKYYSFFVNSSAREDEYFKIWSKSIDLQSLGYHCNYLPFSNFSVRFSGHYINTLQSHLLRSENLSIDPYWQSLDAGFLRATENLNTVIKDLISTCNQYENNIDPNGIITYWVDDQHLEYSQRGLYIEYRKNVLRCLFYMTIKSANLVIKRYNHITKTHQIPYIGFIREYPYNFPILGTPFLSPEEFPNYTNDELETGQLYEGLIKVDNWIRSQVYENP